MKHVILFLILLVGIFSCQSKYTGPEHVSSISYIPSEQIVIEHSSFQNNEGIDLHETMIDSSYFNQLEKNTLFIKSHKVEIGDYLVTHLKSLKTLRLLAVTHIYDVVFNKSSYYICYYKNKNLNKKWGCKLNYSNGKYRLYYQNINAEKDKDFLENYNKCFTPEDLKMMSQ